MEGLHTRVYAITGDKKHSSYNEATNTLTLEKAGRFTYAIAEYEEEYKHINEEINKLKKEAGHSQQMLDKDKGSLNSAYSNDRKIYDQHKKNNDKLQKANAQKLKASEAKLTALKEKYSDIHWIWTVAHEGMHFTNEDYTFAAPYTGPAGLSFPKVLEGGTGGYLEACHYNPVNKTQKNPQSGQQFPQGKLPFGAFVKATGTPKIIGAIWKDKDGKKIEEKAAYGSTVFLHIYTEGLHGHELKVKLRDTKWVNADLSVTARDADGQAVESLDNTGFDTVFHRKVKAVRAAGATETVAKGAVGDILIHDKGKGKEKKKQNITHYQKAMFAVYIDPLWEMQGGHDLTVNPIVYHAGIKDGKADLDTCKLEVSKEDAEYTYTEALGNSPVLVEDSDLKPKDGKKRVDFTFGVFIDGTMNNKYDTIARQDWEDARIAGDKNNPIEHLRVHAEKKEDVAPTENYKYGEVSYENDLSNPAILFKYYSELKSTPEHQIFKVYSEGMGTNTLADNNGNVISYETDDNIGTAFGAGVSGILARVRRAIKLMVDKIKVDEDQTIGTLTIDVFGFSRGAAAARNFVHEITMPPYYATTNSGSTDDVRSVADRSYATDHYDTPVADKYRHNAMMLPSNGHLGYLLTEERQLTFDRLIVRFAGLYDSVPHHGLFQGNDMEYLGLNSIVKSKYTVHLVAGDEHRKNFSLVDLSCITGTKGGGHAARGVELYLPGVHCDVGGSYAEGRPEKNGALMPCSNAYQFEQERKWMIDEGWYQPNELTEIKIPGTNSILSGTRDYVSNQYSFIPLHIMLRFATEKGLEFNTNISTDYKFTDYYGQLPGNSDFLTGIENRLFDYAFNNGKHFDFIPQQEYKETLYYTDPENAAQAYTEYKWRQKEGQKRLDASVAEQNTTIKKLRNKYLHFNANYDSLIGVNEPNIVNNKRKRHIRGAI